MIIFLAAGILLVATGIADLFFALAHGVRERERSQGFADGIQMGRAWEHEELRARIYAIPEPDRDEFTTRRLAKAEAPGSYPDAS